MNTDELIDQEDRREEVGELMTFHGKRLAKALEVRGLTDWAFEIVAVYNGENPQIALAGTVDEDDRSRLLRVAAAVLDSTMAPYAGQEGEA